ncbi:MAG: GAF domain-containing protein [Thermodesulfobacteriota bacterium]
METGSYAFHEVPASYLSRWQKTVDLMARLFNVPAGLIKRVHSREIEVLLASATSDNPYRNGELKDLSKGLYCENVIETRAVLEVSNAQEAPAWNSNPDLALGMISYLGVPLLWPDGRVFGTICVLDRRERQHSKLNQELLVHFKKTIEADFTILAQSEKLIESEKKLRRQSKVLNAVGAVFREALSCENEREFANTFLCHAEKITGSKFGFVGKKNDKGLFDTISISSTGWNGCQMSASEARLRIKGMEIRGIDRATIRDGKSRIVNNTIDHPDRVGLPEGHPEVSSFLGVPLKYAGKTIGMIGLGNKESGYDLIDQQAIEDLSVAFVEALMRKRAEKELIKSEERFRTVADFTYNWESWIDPDGKYLYVSPSFERISGYPPEELLKNSQFSKVFVHPDDQDTFFEHRDAHLNKHDVLDMEFRIVTSGGDTRWISHICQPVYSKEGKWLGRRASNRDVTEQKKIEQQFHQAHKMEAMGTLAGGIAHDFNNILSAILGYGELIADNVAPESILAEDAQQIIGAAHRATELVQQILTFSRQTETRKKPLHPHFIVKEAMKMLRATLPASIGIEERIDTECGTILANPTNIHQVVVNLCTNARQAMASDKGRLRVILDRQQVNSEDIPHDHAGEPGPYVVLSVTDSGCGIEAESIERIFEPYFSTKEKGEGTGLGLSVVHGIVQDCKGFIKVESRVNEGTTVAVYFPAKGKAVEKKSDRDQVRHVHDAVNRRFRIMVVDDDQLLVRINQRRLEGRGFLVDAFEDSRLALEYFQSKPDDFDLLVTDQTMPGLTGEELARGVLEINPELPIIMCTGHSEVVSEEKALAMGISKYVFKPIRDNELLDAVQELLEGK